MENIQMKMKMLKKLKLSTWCFAVLIVLSTMASTGEAAECYALSSQSSGSCEPGVTPRVKECRETLPPKNCNGAILECNENPETLKTEIVVMHGIRSCVHTGDEDDCCETADHPYCKYEQDYYCFDSTSKHKCFMKLEAGIGWKVVSAGVEGGVETEGIQGCKDILDGYARQTGTYTVASSCN